MVPYSRICNSTGTKELTAHLLFFLKTSYCEKFTTCTNRKEPRVASPTILISSPYPMLPPTFWQENTKANGKQTSIRISHS